MESILAAVVPVAAADLPVVALVATVMVLSVVALLTGGLFFAKRTVRFVVPVPEGTSWWWWWEWGWWWERCR